MILRGPSVVVVTCQAPLSVPRDNPVARSPDKERRLHKPHVSVYSERKDKRWNDVDMIADDYLHVVANAITNNVNL